MHRKHRSGLLIRLTAVFVILAPSLALSQAKIQAIDPDKLLGEQILSTDSSVREQAITDIRQRVADHPEAIGGLLRKYWLAPMAKAGFNDDIVIMTQTAVLADPNSVLTFEPMLRGRVYALIALGRKDEALADARRFYNVCGLDQTGRAVDLLAAAMEARFGDEAQAKIRQFRMRQMTAAVATDEPPPASSTTAPTSSDDADASNSNPNAADQMILSIPVDDKLYMAEADKWKNDRRHLTAYGNLLLMAGHADEAYAYFTDLLNRAKTDKELTYALERQSAAMRAQDGNLARAQSRLRRLQAGGM
jgi:hypothetical protein